MAGRLSPEVTQQRLSKILNPGPRTPQEEQAHRLGENLGTAIYNVMESVERWAQERRARRNGTF